MPMIKRLEKVAPYIVMMAGAFVLYAIANRIDFTPIPDQIGPEVWPKMILALLIVVCAYAIVRHLFAPPNAAAADMMAQFALPEDVLLEPEEDHPKLVLGVVVATTVYLLLLETGGFFLCTLVFTMCLMWLGGVRRPLAIGALSLGITVFFTFTFMKVVFVALPIGVQPFSSVSLGVMKLLGIH